MDWRLTALDGLIRFNRLKLGYLLGQYLGLSIGILNSHSRRPECLRRPHCVHDFQYADPLQSMYR